MARKNETNALANATANATANANAANAAAEDVEGKRGNIAKKLYMRAEHSELPADADEVQSRVFGSAERIRFDFSNGEFRLVNPGDFSAEVQNCFTLYGIAQKLGDAYALNAAEVAAAAAEGKSKIEASIDAFDAMLENLASGWISESKASGPRVGDVLEAWERVAREAGMPDEARAQKKENVQALLKAGDVNVGDGTPKAYREYVLGNKKIAAAIAAIKAERATARAAAAAEKAGAAPAGEDDLFS